MRKYICFVLILVFAVVAASQPALADGYRSHGHSRGYGHSHFSGSIWIGPGWGPWWGPYSYPYPAPYVYPSPYGYYAPYPEPYYVPPVVETPDTYIQQEPQREEERFWYYCKDPQGYFPYVKRCPSGWMKVVPSLVPPAGKE
jgi:hypothetical protein